MNRVEPLDQSIGTNSTDLPQDDSEDPSNDGDDRHGSENKPSSAETLKMEDVEKSNEDVNHTDHDISDSRNEETPTSEISNDTKDILEEKLVKLDEKPERKIIETLDSDEVDKSEHESDSEKWFVTFTLEVVRYMLYIISKMLCSMHYNSQTFDWIDPKLIVCVIMNSPASKCPGTNNCSM